MRAKGFIHIHSTYSDGEMSLVEIKKRAKASKTSFALLADHLPWISPAERFEEFIKECRRLSDESFIMIPGFETVSSEGYHILVYNGVDFIKEGMPLEKIIKSFSGKGSMIALAHASQVPEKPSQSLLEKIDGIEAWNAKYDSRYAPDFKSLAWVPKGKTALAGDDAHSIYSLGKLWVDVEIEGLVPESVINALKNNKFFISNGLVAVNFSRPINPLIRFYFKIGEIFLSSSKKFFRSAIKRNIKNPPEIIKKIYHKFY